MRTTINPKENVVKVRVTDNMAEYLKKVSTVRGISVSEYLRKLVETDMGK
nr:MAG TPA: hypothetical protein [Caudoviricetes sp.]